jgi:hypothetical protein
MVVGVLHLMRPLADGTGSQADEWARDLSIIAAITCLWVGIARIRATSHPRMPRVVAWGLLAVVPVFIVAAVVVPPSLRPQIAKIRPRSTARLEIVSPTPGQTVSGSLLVVRLRLIGGTITPTTSTHLTPNTGHIHISVDGSLVSMLYGMRQMVDVSQLAPGRHALTAEFVAVDHGPFDPRVIASVSFVKR